MNCEHKVWTKSNERKPCGKPVRCFIKSGPDGKSSSIDGQKLCGVHARFWRDRLFSVESIDELLCPNCNRPECKNTADIACSAYGALRRMYIRFQLSGGPEVVEAETVLELAGSISPK